VSRRGIESAGRVLLCMGKRRLLRFMGVCLSSGFRVCRKVGQIFVAGVTAAAGYKLPARVLPELAFAVPMETKLGQGGGDMARRLLVKLNPNPLADNLTQFPKTRGLVINQVQKSGC